MSNLLHVAHETVEKGAGSAPYVIGGVVLVLLFILLLITVAIGGGREHS